MIDRIEELWPLPEGRDETRRAAKIVRDYLVRHEVIEHGGGGKFYTPAEWRDRGESYGLDALVIVTHDGGDHAGCFNWDYEQYGLLEGLMEHLRGHGLWMEQCTSWYTAIFAQ